MYGRSLRDYSMRLHLVLGNTSTFDFLGTTFKSAVIAFPGWCAISATLVFKASKWNRVKRLKRKKYVKIVLYEKSSWLDFIRELKDDLIRLVSPVDL